jgi:hypothetical protein
MLRNTRNLECLLKKATGNDQIQPKREAMWAAAGKAIGTGLLKSLGVHVMPPYAPCARYGATDLMFVLLGLCLALVSFLLVIFLFFPFEMGMFTLSHCILRYFFLYTETKLDFILSLRGYFKLKILNNVEIVKTLGTFGDGLNIFGFVRWT